MLRAALIGFPGSGRTALFQLLTSAREAPRAAGRTEANVGVSRVPDERLDRLTALFRPRKHVPATVEFADIAGSAGARAGAQALLDVAAFRNADALLHVVRMFRDPAVPHAAGSIDPARDVRTMEDEVILADLGVVERRLERLERDLKKAATIELRRERDSLLRCRSALESGRPLRALELEPEDARRLRGFQFLSAKPLLLVLNLDETDLPRADDAVRLAGVDTFMSGAATHAVPICARIELEIAQLEPVDAAAFMADLGLRESGLDRVIRASYDLLGYISFFTVGDDECRAWSIPRGTPAVIAAGEIHSDISRGFIRAEVVRYDHLLARGSLAACREHGELRLEGKDYLVVDGDVINFRHAT
ncbi:MAG TPA: redox-regulated ATPase YchF [Vicinamibacterales bacterium]|nr:redox-regulated ATPase YchF [Vicinamibacterales bacterium]